MGQSAPIRTLPGARKLRCPGRRRGTGASSTTLLPRAVGAVGPVGAMRPVGTVGTVRPVRAVGAVGTVRAVRTMGTVRAVPGHGHFHVVQAFSGHTVLATEGVPGGGARHEKERGDLGRLFAGDLPFLTEEEVLRLFLETWKLVFHRAFLPKRGSFRRYVSFMRKEHGPVSHYRPTGEDVKDFLVTRRQLAEQVVQNGVENLASGASYNLPMQTSLLRIVIYRAHAAVRLVHTLHAVRQGLQR